MCTWFRRGFDKNLILLFFLWSYDCTCQKKIVRIWPVSRGASHHHPNHLLESNKQRQATRCYVAYLTRVFRVNLPKKEKRDQPVLRNRDLFSLVLRWKKQQQTTFNCRRNREPLHYEWLLARTFYSASRLDKSPAQSCNSAAKTNT